MAGVRILIVSSKDTFFLSFKCKIFPAIFCVQLYVPRQQVFFFEGSV